MLYVLALLALVAGVVVDSAFHRGSHILYSDADHRTLRPARALRAPRLGLLAKPDYVLREDGELVVEEVKSGWVRGAPYSHHVIQLGVEMLVVEEAFRRRPPRGRLRYRNRTIAIANTEGLRQQVLEMADRYRAVADGQQSPMPTRDVAKCRKCPVQALCPIGSANAPGVGHHAD